MFLSGIPRYLNVVNIIIILIFMLFSGVRRYFNVVKCYFNVVKSVIESYCARRTFTLKPAKTLHRKNTKFSCGLLPSTRKSPDYGASFKFRYNFSLTLKLNFSSQGGAGRTEPAGVRDSNRQLGQAQGPSGAALGSERRSFFLRHFKVSNFY